MNCSSITLSGYNYSRCADAASGGVKEIYVALRDDLKNTPGVDYDGAIVVVNGEVTAINTKTESLKPFHRFKFKKETTSMTSTAEISDNGASVWNTEVALQFPHMNAAKRASMMSLFLADTVVIVRDGNDELHYLGADYAVNASAGGGETGTAISDANQYTLTLRDTAYEAPFLIAAEMVEKLAAMIAD